MHRHWVQFTLVRRGYDNNNGHNKPLIGNETGVWITSCPEAMGWEFGNFEKHVSWTEDAEVRASGRQRALGPQWPTVEQPQLRWERSAVMIRRTLGRYSSLSPSPTHLSHTQHHSFGNKVWEIYFYKEVCSFVHWSSYIVFNCVSTYICICIWLYNRINLKIPNWDVVTRVIWDRGHGMGIFFQNRGH